MQDMEILLEFIPRSGYCIVATLTACLSFTAEQLKYEYMTPDYNPAWPAGKSAKNSSPICEKGFARILDVSFLFRKLRYVKTVI